jgi:hypothetical protein
MLRACELMKQGNRFVTSERSVPRRSPSVTAAKRAGDCKSKALWLLDSLGDPTAFYVIGKSRRRSASSHAWVYWRHEGRWWILDPTHRAQPIAADSVPADRYVPYYSYGKAGAYRHDATRIYLAQSSHSTVPEVATSPARSSQRRLVRR